MKGRYVRRRVPKTTNNITRSIINFLNAAGHVAARINTQGQYDERLNGGRGGWRKSGSTVGVWDITCTLAPRGRTLIVDVKKGSDTLSPEQMAYGQAVVHAGGLAYEAAGAEEFEDFYFTTIAPNL